jgi:acyl-CoA dehydrogenase
MDLSLSEEQRLLVDTARRFVRAELMPLEDEIEASRRLDPNKARAIFEKSRALGLYAMNIPTVYGGGGLSAVDTCLVEEQFGHTTDILVRRAFGNVYEVLLEGTDAQKQRWLLPAVRGERTFSVCFSEPGAGSDAAGIKTRATRDGAGWVLNGNKHFISDGLFSDFFVVSAVTDPAAGVRGISLFLVDKGMSGFTIGRDQPMMGLAGTSHVEMFFDGVRLGPECLLGREGQGLKLALETLGRIRLAHIGARAVGKASRLLGMMTDYARDRRQFDRPIGDFQMVQLMLADSAIEIQAARLLVLHAASRIDRGRDAREHISMVKVFAAETLGRVADRAVQVFGGMGYCKDLPIERLYRDARIFRIFDGTSEIHRGVVARGLSRHGAALVDPPA